MIEVPAAVTRARDAACARWPGLTLSATQLAATLGPLAIEPAWFAARGAELVLAHAAAAGDPVAVGALEQEFLAPTRAVVQRYAREAARTDEVVQLVRIHLLVSPDHTPPRLARFDGRAALGAWLGMVATRVALQALRTERARREVALEWSEALAGLPAADPVVERLRDRHAARIAMALRDACLELSRRHRAVLRWLFVDGASVDEVATVYGVHRVTVGARVQGAGTSLSVGDRPAPGPILRCSSK